MNANGLAEAEAILREAAGERLRRGFCLAPLTTFRIGGNAALYLEPESNRDLEAAGRAVRKAGIPVVVIGKGSNILVSDAGFPGLVLRLGRGFRWVARNGEQVSAGAATPVPAMANVALQHGLTGLEFGVAIPASLGGAVWMNAGAHGHAMADVVTAVHVYLLYQGRLSRIDAADAGFGYRRSGMPDGAVVTGAELVLSRGDREAIRAQMDEARDWRRETQPLAEPNCGSVFTNPEGDQAARLVEAVGGKRVVAGGARVSEKHANFIVTSEGAKAADVVEIIRRLQDEVEQQFGILLKPEVQLIGEFDQAPR